VGDCRLLVYQTRDFFVPAEMKMSLFASGV
jgi:hypothetical protein